MRYVASNAWLIFLNPKFTTGLSFAFEYKAEQIQGNPSNGLTSTPTHSLASANGFLSGRDRSVGRARAVGAHAMLAVVTWDTSAGHQPVRTCRQKEVENHCLERLSNSHVLQIQSTRVTISPHTRCLCDICNCSAQPDICEVALVPRPYSWLAMFSELPFVTIECFVSKPNLTIHSFTQKLSLSAYCVAGRAILWVLITQMLPAGTRN